MPVLPALAWLRRHSLGRLVIAIAVVVALVVALALAAVPTPQVIAINRTPTRGAYISIADVPAQSPTIRSGGTFTSPCGRNEDDHHNNDNLITLPHQPGAAQHVHEYVGNQTVDADSTDEELVAATTSCRNGDQSAYFWTVLRDTRLLAGRKELDAWDGGAHNPGIRLPAVNVTVEFRGNRVAPVVPMPRFLRMLAGNARATTTPVAGASQARWSCSGSPERRTQLYPLCPAGQLAIRTYDFPSCWDGLHTDSASHRSHVTYPTSDGSCPRSTFPVPQLRLQVEYAVPSGRSYAIDSFADQHRSPATDHAEFVNVMTVDLMVKATRCINAGLHC